MRTHVYYRSCTSLQAKSNPRGRHTLSQPMKLTLVKTVGDYGTSNPMQEGLQYVHRISGSADDPIRSKTMGSNPMHVWTQHNSVAYPSATHNTG